MEAERKLIFEEYVTELKQREVVRVHSSPIQLLFRSSYHTLIVESSKRPGQLEHAVFPRL
jgi:hypothetical protein